MKSTSLKKSSLINELKLRSLESVRKLCLNISAYPFLPNRPLEWKKHLFLRVDFDLAGVLGHVYVDGRETSDIRIAKGQARG